MIKPGQEILPNELSKMAEKVIIIAEAGVNHNGDLARAKKLIDAAAAAGADYVKFQTFKTEKIVSRYAKKADYQLKNFSDIDDSQFNMLKKLEMPLSWYEELIKHSEARSIKFLSTGFDEESVDFLDELGVNIFKIPSGEITNKNYLKHIAHKKKQIILSTGMSDLQEIKNALDVLKSCKVREEDIIVLHCNTQYPTPMADVNLLAMNSMSRNLNVKVGYSDHTLGIEVPVAAVALGARVIEKHFTLDRSLPGPDHLASLEPQELKDMVSAIRNIELAISGSGIKEATESETANKTIVRKSLHYCVKLYKGEVIKKEQVIAIRPGNGISPMEIDDVIGTTLKVDVEAMSMIKYSDFI